MTTVEFTALMMLSTATSFSPGPNTTLSTALAANLGLKRSMRFVLAVPAGWGLLFSICAGGVGALVVAVPPLRIAIQALGVGYMLWLALKILRSSTLTQASAAQLNITFWQGVMLQFLNIKAWMLALAVVAGCISLHLQSSNENANSTTNYQRRHFRSHGWFCRIADGGRYENNGRCPVRPTSRSGSSLAQRP